MRRRLQEMSWSLAAACFWVLASAVTAMLPRRNQYAPGITLLALAPVLIGWLAYDHGLWIAALGLVGFLSMFRNPLIYFAKRAMGIPTGLPPEDQR
jgi:hypothetical protein